MKNCLVITLVLIGCQITFAQTDSTKRNKEQTFGLITLIHAQLLNNEIDFSKAAQLYSDDKSTKEKCGDIGWVPRGVLIPGCENELFKLPVKGISKPFLTEFGFMIFQLLERDGELCHARFLLLKFEI